MSLNPTAKLHPDLYDRNKLKHISTREGYGQGLVAAGKKDKNVVVLCGDLTKSTSSDYFKKLFPERFVEVGVAEQNMLGIAAGLALSGKTPFVSTFGVFCPGRNWDQLRISVCYSQANVKMVGAHTGVSVGPDGATHQALEDIALTRCLPNLTVLAPSDYTETKKATIAAATIKGPVYLRFTRNNTPAFTTAATPFKIGRAEVYQTGNDVSIVACGPLLYEALVAAKTLEAEGIKAQVINNHTVKPLDEETIIKAARETKAMVTVEDHQIMGGLGSAITETIGKHYPVPVEMIGIQDSFGQSGKAEELWEKYQLSATYIIQAVKKVIRRKV